MGEEKYFIVKREKITPVLHQEAQQEQDDHWRSLVFPSHGDTVAFVTTALHLLRYSKLPIFHLPPLTWNLDDEEP